MALTRIAIERRQPHCPRCASALVNPSMYVQLGAITIRCACGLDVAARFWVRQEVTPAPSGAGSGEAALEPDRQRHEQLDTDEHTGARRATAARDPRHA